MTHQLFHLPWCGVVWCMWCGVMWCGVVYVVWCMCGGVYLLLCSVVEPWPHTRRDDAVFGRGRHPRARPAAAAALHVRAQVHQRTAAHCTSGGHTYACMLYDHTQRTFLSSTLTYITIVARVVEIFSDIFLVLHVCLMHVI